MLATMNTLFRISNANLCAASHSGGAHRVTGVASFILLTAVCLKRGQQTPILVRTDGARFVLIEGLHRLEAARALGEKTIIGFLVDARKH